MLFKLFKPKIKDESIFEKLVKTPAHVQDILLDKYFIQGSDQPTGDFEVLSNLEEMYQTLMSIEKPCMGIYLNPFSGKHVLIELNPIKKTENDSSYMITNDKTILKQEYFGSFKVVIKKSNVQDGNFKNDFNNFKAILYHELAHAHFVNILTVFSHEQEINADLSGIIYSIKQENLNLTETLSLIDDTLIMRLNTANFLHYSRHICNRSRVHATEAALILFRSMDDEILNTLKTIEYTDIVRYVTVWLKTVSGLLFNPYQVDFNNKKLLSFIFYNNYKSTLMKLDSESTGYIRSAHMRNSYAIKRMFKQRFNLAPATDEELGVMKEFCHFNALHRLDIFNDIIISHGLINEFNHTVNHLFNKDDYKYLFLDSIAALKSHQENRTNNVVDIHFGYNKKELNNYIKSNYCKM